jgi:hypothetical protein
MVLQSGPDGPRGSERNLITSPIGKEAFREVLVTKLLCAFCTEVFICLLESTCFLGGKI